MPNSLSACGVPARASLRTVTAAALASLAAVAPASSVLAQPAAAVRAFTGATLIDGTTRAPIANSTLLVRDGRVVAASCRRSGWHR